MIVRRATLTAVVLGLAVATSGCSTVTGAVDRINPFKPKEVKDEAADGRRISVIAFDEKVAVADGLNGVDFFIPPAAPQPDWTLPGGPTEVAVENVERSRVGHRW